MEHVVATDPTATLRAGKGRPRSAAEPPEQVPLSRLFECMEAILAAIDERGELILTACRRARVSKHTFLMWRALRREPSIAKLASLARAVGYDLVMIRGAAEIPLEDAAAIVTALEAERKRRCLTILDIDNKFGVPNRSWSYWRAGVRPPSLGPLVILAEAFGYDVVMRRARSG